MPRIYWPKIVVFLLCLLPFFDVLYGALSNSLGADPQKTILLTFGDWSLRFLLLTLSMSVLRRRFKVKRAINYRRMLGLFSMFYVTLHLLSYYVFYLGLSFDELAFEISDRPYLIIGFCAWLMLIPLTFTSTKKAMRWLGKRWQQLHYLVYVIVALGWIHFFMQVKSDINEPLTYGLIIFCLAVERAFFWHKKRSKQHQKATRTV